MNIKLLTLIKQQILDDPDSFSMGGWLVRSSRGNIDRACIAGWACELSGFKPTGCQDRPTKENEIPYTDIPATAAKLLGLELDQRHRLFHTSHWPDHFFNCLLSTDSRQGQAAIAAARIDHFIATNGNE